ncbi:MAG: type 2 lantipeptide synthetase LanM [Chloroflexi bacterium AL-W]|nr:type 2 lantipeptide synthetase LanM [Chloroflexi bacterium AL-N1]NOK66781.1 type 2 lantipeptide synthetase LanM [Chloroflexi bacterium AL-N10]NOK74927.1 type 2 lantipeptide synthetase LanM [Chloroflexi bacterium AL-N5]NOK81384.1 type 2 lantipeptide synthetase LanM [Chloroflexi bacterium AL-W]NOK88853.1 type 2 lantipeptide synthetase LanM [Chloroflexi bacterium AL-N15]
MFSSSRWSYALTFQERLALRRAALNKPAYIDPTDAVVQRFEQWRQSFHTADQFTQRLASDHLSEDEALALFGETPEGMYQNISQTPEWLLAFEQAYTDSDEADMTLPEAFQGQSVSPFLEIIRPLISQSRTRMQRRIADLPPTAHPHIFNSETLVDIMLTTLPWKTLVSMVGRTMALELQVARLLGLLQGNTSKERFWSFIERLRQEDTRIRLFEEYPVLARQLTQTFAHWEQSCHEFLQRLCTDWEVICSTFSSHLDPGPIVSVHSNLSDSHQRGRMVLIVSFEGGMRLVYKPRSLAIDVHFQELLIWLNALNDIQSFRVLQVLDRDTHGWVEYVEAQECDSLDEVHRFYERQGQYLALLYALNATDIFYENIIAAGEHPVLIDLETLFHPLIDPGYKTSPATFAMRVIDETVLRTGMLPRRLWADVDRDGIDISALGMQSGGVMPGVLAWENPGTDTMQIGIGSIQMPAGKHRPLLQGHDVDVTEHIDAIVDGFQVMYHVLIDHRDDLLAPDGPIMRFVSDEIRVILRPTITYSALLRESFHPDLLRDALDRDCFFDQLWSAVEQRPFLIHVIAAEHDDLLHGDIPIFTTRPGSCHIWTSTGSQINNFFTEPVFKAVHQRMYHLDEKVLSQQIWFIRASLATTGIDEGIGQWKRYQLNRATPVTSDQLIAEACAIGNRIGALSVQHGSDVSWIGLTLERNRYWTLAPLGVDLYAGQTGIVLFLAYLGAITQEQRYTDLARCGLATTQRQLASVQRLDGFRIGMDGLGGIIYTLTHLGTLWNDQTLIDEAMRIAGCLPALIEQDTYFDIVSGAAGCIVCLIPLYQQKPTEILRTTLVQCGSHILAGAHTMDQGIGWTSPGASVPLAGLAHGCAGIAWALTALAKLVGEQDFAGAAHDALVYERSLFDPVMENWPYIDGSNETSGWDTRLVAAWCHGAPGIGLARLQMLYEMDDIYIREEINTALNTTLANGFGLNHSLCHGDLGNIELFIQAGQHTDETIWQSYRDQLVSGILDDIKHVGWRCGVPDTVESPGLMTGLAGIGYGLLRLSEPSRIPSVLTFAPPPIAG